MTREENNKSSVFLDHVRYGAHSQMGVRCAFMKNCLSRFLLGILHCGPSKRVLVDPVAQFSKY